MDQSCSDYDDSVSSESRVFISGYVNGELLGLDDIAPIEPHPDVWMGWSSQHTCAPGYASFHSLSTQFQAPAPAIAGSG